MATSSLLVLLRRSSQSTRAWLGCVVVLSLASRLLILATALAIGHGEVRAAFYAGVVATGSFAAQRLAHAVARIGLERDVHRAAVASLLETDVLAVSREGTQRVVFEGSFHAVLLMGSVAPALASDVLASIAIAPVLMVTFPPRVLVIALGAMALVGAGVIVARRVGHRGEQELAALYEEVADTMLVAVEGRLEIVARGGEDAFMARFASMSNRYASRAYRVGLVSAWLGRAPLFVGAVAIAAIALVDTAARAQLTTAVVTRAIVLAACLPPILGAVVGAQAVARTTVLVRPFLHLLSTERRHEERVAGTSAPNVPARFELVAASFRYATDLPFVIEDLSLVWTAAEPLALVGANGAGKSTLLRLLMSLRPPTSGTLRVDGREAASLDLRALRRSFAYLPQRPYLGEAHASIRAAVHMTVPDATDAAIEETLQRVRLLATLHARAGGADVLAWTVGKLSAGQRQRLALARVLLQDAPVVFLDEPDANLDQDGVKLVASLIAELSANGRLVAIAVHTPELTALCENPVVLG